jgi:hypothetical protein
VFAYQLRKTTTSGDEVINPGNGGTDVVVTPPKPVVSVYANALTQINLGGEFRDGFKHYDLSTILVDDKVLAAGVAPKAARYIFTGFGQLKVVGLGNQSGDYFLENTADCWASKPKRLSPRWSVLTL